MPLLSELGGCSGTRALSIDMALLTELSRTLIPLETAERVPCRQVEAGQPLPAFLCRVGLGTAVPNRTVSAVFDLAFLPIHSGRSVMDGNSLSGKAAAPCLSNS